jgi:hypothetical protein
MPLRATREAEAEGLDMTQHGEEAYLHDGGMEAVKPMMSSGAPGTVVSTQTI